MVYLSSGMQASKQIGSGGVFYILISLGQGAWPCVGSLSSDLISPCSHAEFWSWRLSTENTAFSLGAHLSKTALECRQMMGLALWHNAQSRCQQHYHPIWVPMPVLAALFLIKLPGNMPEKASQDGQVLGSLNPSCEKPRWSSRLLATAWPNPRCCSH